MIIRDHPFLLFMLSSVFATMTYVATETLLPISVDDDAPPRARGVGRADDRQPAARDRLPAAPDALDGAHPGVGEARRRDADDGRAVPAPELERQRARDRARDLHLRDRRDALGADVAGGRRRARAGGHPRRLHGRLRRHPRTSAAPTWRLRQHVVGRLGADAVPRPAGARQLRRRDDVDVRRGASACSPASPGSSQRAATTPRPL